MPFYVLLKNRKMQLAIHILFNIVQGIKQKTVIKILIFSDMKTLYETLKKILCKKYFFSSKCNNFNYAMLQLLHVGN